MARKRLRQLKDQAAEAMRRGRLDAAISSYEELERREPREASWPRRKADAFRRLGRPTEELLALVRAADLYAASGFAIQAVAACKLILRLDPTHSSTQERLAALQADNAEGASPSPAPARLPDPGPTATSRDAPLDELVLTEVVADTRPAFLDDEVREGVAEIPLESTTGEFDVGLANAGGDQRSAAEQLRATPLFGSLSGGALRRLIDGVRLVELSEGEMLFCQGDRADALYVVADGAVVPVAEADPAAGLPQRTRLAVLEAGSFFGEIGLVTDQPRTATIEALVDTRLLAIDRSLLWSLIRECPDVFTVTLRFLRERLIDRLVRTHPLFAAFARTERSRVARHFRWLEVQDGSLVVEQGRPAPALFVLLSGQMQVIYMDLDGDKVLGTLKPGDLCGERSLIEGEAARAAVVASGKCWLLALDERRFQRIVARNPELAQVVARVARERERQNETTLRGVGRDESDVGWI